MGRSIEKTIANNIVNLIKEEKSPDADVQIRSLKTYVSLRFCEVPAIKIVWGKKKKYISISPNFKQLLKEYDFIATEIIKSDPWVRIIVRSQSELERLNPLIVKIYDEAYLMSSVEHFGCCSRYKKCSDERRCIQPDQLLAKGCAYKLHLEAGRVFYGKNRNV